jgi:hypothetical protein
MDLVFISMPYSRFYSKWFAGVPNINLGIMQALLKKQGRSVKTFHFHLEFLPFVKKLGGHIMDNFIKISEPLGVEYMGLDYIFASLLFEDAYSRSQDRFTERLSQLDLSSSDFEELREAARSFAGNALKRISPYLKNTKLVGFSCSHYQLSSSLFLCRNIRERFPEVKTILGGKDCSGAFAHELMSNTDYIDFSGIGECEVTVEQLLRHIEGNPEELRNVLFRDGENGILQSSSQVNHPINSLPFPEYDFDDFPLRKDELILPLEFGRGCPWKRCTFCPDESYNILCQAKTAERIQEEIEHYQSVSPDLRNFFILDSDALKNPQTIIDVSGFFEGKQLDFHYAEFRAEKMDRDVLGAVARFGKWISNFQVGIETFSDGVLTLMNKGVTALKNVEVIKSAAELGVPIQSNLFTCYPQMTTEDMMENNRIMELITHLLVCENIQIFPGEFYLPADCAVFIESNRHRLRKHSESVFACAFEEFPMPSYSNYPYPYQFENDEEQFRNSGIIRNKIDEIKSKSPQENYMIYAETPDGLRIETCRDSQCTTHQFGLAERDVYISAAEKIKQTGEVSRELNMPIAEVCSVLDDFEKKGLILYSSDRQSFLSLATRERCKQPGKT